MTCYSGTTSDRTPTKFQQVNSKQILKFMDMHFHQYIITTNFKPSLDFAASQSQHHKMLPTKAPTSNKESVIALIVIFAIFAAIILILLVISNTVQFNPPLRNT
jgi:hypothetical protein